MRDQGRRRRDGGRADSWPRVELAGRRYVILPETAYERLQRAAQEKTADWLASAAVEPFAADKEELGARIRGRRREAGLTQARLAAEAGIRVETLNRIERGHTTPDFATIRKLVEALERTDGGHGRTR